MEQDILSLCRVCLKLRDNYFVPIFDENYFESQITIWETISEVFNVIVTMDDRLPQSICAECCNNITLAKNMKDLFEKTDIYLKNCLAIIPQVNIQIKEENFFWDENDDDKPKVQLSAVDISSMADPNDKQANKCSEKTVRKRSIKSKPTTLNNHICSYCGKIFRLPKSLRIHEQVLSCYICTIRLT